MQTRQSFCFTSVEKNLEPPGSDDLRVGSFTCYFLSASFSSFPLVHWSIQCPAPLSAGVSKHEAERHRRECRERDGLTFKKCKSRSCKRQSKRRRHVNLVPPKKKRKKKRLLLPSLQPFCHLKIFSLQSPPKKH